MTDDSVNLPELLIPAGTLSKLRVALAYGADGVYAGAAGLSMRPDEASIAVDELRTAVDETHALGRSIYVAVNTMMFDADMAVVREWLDATSDLAFDGLIVSDMGVFGTITEMRPDVPIHISTQMSTANSDAAAFWKRLGASRVVLARECSLEQVGRIAAESGIDIEIFVHGAMCMAISGRCLLSAHLCGQSGSRGECKHTCRWEWQLVEKSRPGMSIPVFETERETIFLGSTDLCMIDLIPEIIATGARSLKVEGRMKGEYYIAAVTRVYREALDSYRNDPENYRTREEWINELNAVSHRQYSTGFAFGYPERGESIQSGNRPDSTHETLGCVDLVTDGLHSIQAKNPLVVGEDADWIGPYGTGGTVQVARIIDEAGKDTARSHCGTAVKVALAGGAELPQYAILRKAKAEV